MNFKEVILFVLFVFFITLHPATAALGISPAIKAIDYEPGKEVIVSYSVTEDDPKRELEVYVGEGLFSDYVVLSTDTLVGGGGFTATIQIPEELPPGPHQIRVGVRQLPPENVFIGTAINLGARIDLFVPYPGRYIEPRLIVPTINTGEGLPVELLVINRGKETLTIDPTIKVGVLEKGGLKGEPLSVIEFTPVTLATGQERYFRKIVDTNGFPAAEYISQARIQYGADERIINTTFNIGTLNATIVNMTERLPLDGLQRFNIHVKSGWNDPIPDLYAEITLTNEEGIAESIRTPPIVVEPWKVGTLEAFIDTNLLGVGAYRVDVVLHYVGTETIGSGSLEIYEPVNYIVYVIIGGILLFIVLVLLIVWVIKKRNIKKMKQYKKNIKKNHGS